MKRTYLTPHAHSTDFLIEDNLLNSNLLPGSESEKFSDDGEFDWGDNN
jgi:hypothetical protein